MSLDFGLRVELPARQENEGASIAEEFERWQPPSEVRNWAGVHLLRGRKSGLPRDVP